MVSVGEVAKVRTVLRHAPVDYATRAASFYSQEVRGAQNDKDITLTEYGSGNYRFNRSQDVNQW